MVNVLRSGWLASGPKVLELEAALSTLPRRPAGARAQSRDRRAGNRLARVRYRPGRRSHHAGAELRRYRERHRARWARGPVFVDVDLDTRNLDLDQVEAAITPRTRAIMPVHFAGLPVDMDRTARRSRKSAACG